MAQGGRSKAFDGDIIMIDSSFVRVHQHAATGKRGIKTMAAWGVPVAAGPPKSTRISMPMVDRSVSHLQPAKLMIAAWQNHRHRQSPRARSCWRKGLRYQRYKSIWKAKAGMGQYCFC